MTETETGSTTRTRGATRAFALILLATGCGSDSGGAGARDQMGDYFPTTSIVFGEESTSTYLSLLPSLEEQAIDYDAAKEFAGWADLW